MYPAPPKNRKRVRIQKQKCRDVVVVDSSVWIDFFTARPTAACGELDRLLGDGKARLVVPDLVLYEVLRGFRQEKTKRQAQALLKTLSIERCGGERIALTAAGYCRHLRQLGIPIYSAIDVLIAAFCIERGYLLLYSDRDYDALAAHCELQLWQF